MTLYGSDILQSAGAFMTAGLLGILFGLFLEQAGFGSSRRLTGVFYFKDMSVVKVMFTAVLVAMIGARYLMAVGWLREEEILALPTWWHAQVLGGLLLGAGFVMGGWCPGTGLVGIASGKLDALVFVIGVLLGSLLFNEVFPLLAPLYEGGPLGVRYLYETLQMSPRFLTLLAALLGLGLFALCGWIERSNSPEAGPKTLSLVGKVVPGLLLLASAGGLFLLGDPPPHKAPALGASGFLPAVAAGEDHIACGELADRLMAGEGDLLLVDIREPDLYREFHIRGAVNIPLEDLMGALDRLPRRGLIVLYGNGTTHAAQAWLELRHWGRENIRVLTDGLLGFWRECLTPPALAEGVDREVAEAEATLFRKRAAFFLEGGPKRGPG